MVISKGDHDRCRIRQKTKQQQQQQQQQNYNSSKEQIKSNDKKAITAGDDVGL